MFTPAPGADYSAVKTLPPLIRVPSFAQYVQDTCQKCPERPIQMVADDYRKLQDEADDAQTHRRLFIRLFVAGLSEDDRMDALVILMNRAPGKAANEVIAMVSKRCPDAVDSAHFETEMARKFC